MSEILTTSDLSPGEALRLREELDVPGASLTVGAAIIPLSEPLQRALRLLLDELAAGHDVEVARVEPYLTTTQAAQVLHVSRPTLVKFLEEGLLEYEKPGVHRRIPRAGVERFLEESKLRRRKGLEEFAQTQSVEEDEVVTTR